MNNTEMYTMNYLGELAALLTAVFWTVTALAFEAATKRVGTYAVNILRLLMAFVFLGLLNWIRRGSFLPLDASQDAWLWLSLSGLIGFVLGDLFLFASYPLITSRVAMLIMTLVPPLTAIISFLILGERMQWIHLMGMFMVMSGIILTVWNRENKHSARKLQFHPRGILYAFLGSVGQAVGLVLSKLGMGQYDAFASTHIRIIAGIAGFIVLISVLKKWPHVFKAIRNKEAMSRITLGAFFGPFLGVSFSLLAVQLTLAGIASSIMAIVPVLIIPPAILIFKQKVKPIEWLGAFISVAGVVVFFI